MDEFEKALDLTSNQAKRPDGKVHGPMEQLSDPVFCLCVCSGMGWNKFRFSSCPGDIFRIPWSRTLCFRTMSSWGDVIGIHTYIFTLAGNSMRPHFFCKSITYLGLLPWVKWSYFPIQENKILQVIYWCVNYHFQRRAKEHCGFSNCSFFEHVFIFVKLWSIKCY